MKRAAALLALACCACKHETKPAATFALRRVSATEIARLEAQVGKDAPLPATAGDLVERVRGLVLDRAHAQGKLRALSLQEVAALGDPAVAVLDALLDDQERTAEEQISALEVLGAIDTTRSSDALVKRIDFEKFRGGWFRAQAAFQLAKLSSDHVVARLLPQLKYENDGETVIWIAAVLAKHGNYAGLDGLRVLAQRGESDQVRADAQAMLQQLAEAAHYADGEALYAAWYSADGAHAAAAKPPSARLQLEVWKRIALLAEFDLRIVDDARFVLSRSARWVVEPLSAALHEESAYMRVHVAQSLERMGARASGACGALVEALDEPHVAAAAAHALGELRCVDALNALSARARPGTDPELRNAAVAALGKLGSPLALPVLRPLLVDGEPIDLQQEAAQALLALGEHAPALPVLVKCLTRLDADPAAAETALEAWLTRSAAQSDAALRGALADWTSAASTSTETPSAAQATARRAQRAQALERSLPTLRALPSMP